MAKLKGEIYLFLFIYLFFSQVTTPKSKNKQEMT